MRIGDPDRSRSSDRSCGSTNRLAILTPDADFDADFRVAWRSRQDDDVGFFVPDSDVSVEESLWREDKVRSMCRGRCR